MHGPIVLLRLGFSLTGKEICRALGGGLRCLSWNAIPPRPMSISSEISAVVSKRGWLSHFISALSLNRHAVRTLFNVSDGYFLIRR